MRVSKNNRPESFVSKRLVTTVGGIILTQLCSGQSLGFKNYEDQNQNDLDAISNSVPSTSALLLKYPFD